MMKSFSAQQAHMRPLSDAQKNTWGEVVQGLLTGTQVGDFDLEKILTCIYQGDQAAMMLYQDIHILESAWKKKDLVEGIIGGIILVQFGHQLRSVLSNCMPMSAKWGTFDAIIHTIESADYHVTPEAVASGFDDMHIAMKAYDQKNYHNFGQFLGEGLVKVTGATN